MNAPAFKRASAYIVGKQYGRWTVVSFAHRNKRSLNFWNCVCNCGSLGVVSTTALRHRTSQSCGCLSSERHSAQMVARNTTHGMSGREEYRIWKDIVKRCRNPRHDEYSVYGGRGIDICDEWRLSFLAFFEHIGPRPSQEHSVDRINNDGNYEPGNVRWALRGLQRRNCQASRIHLLTFRGKTQCMTDWARELAIPYGRLKARINKFGWDVEAALTKEKRHA